MNTCYKHIHQILSDLDIHIHSQVHHPSVLTCKEADKYLDDANWWLKNLLVKSRQGMFICVILWWERLDFKKLKIEVWWKASFVEEGTWMTLIGCEPGSMPPFWLPEGIQILADQKVFNEPILYFNPWINTQTIWITSADYQAILQGYGGRIVDIV